MQGRMNLAGALALLGAGAMIVGLSLDWYRPQLSGWVAFELVDLLLAAIAVGIVAAILGRSPGRVRSDALARWLPVAAVAALALVAASMVNPPPTAVDRSLEAGAWLSLGAAIVLVGAALLATSEVSIVVTMRPRRRDRREDTIPAPPPAEPGVQKAPPESADEPVTDESPLVIDDDSLDEEATREVVAEDADEVLADEDEEDETRPLPPEER